VARRSKREGKRTKIPKIRMRNLTRQTKGRNTEKKKEKKLIKGKTILVSSFICGRARTGKGKSGNLQAY